MMFRSFAIVMSAVFLSLVTMFGSHADDMAEKLKVAAEYVAISKENMQVDKMVDVTIDQIAATFRVQVPGFDDEKERKLRELAQPILREQMDRTFFRLDRVVAEIYTLEELTAMNAFMGSEIGKSIMRKMPLYQAKVQPVLMNGIQARMPDIIRMLQEAEIIPRQ